MSSEGLSIDVDDTQAVQMLLAEIGGHVRQDELDAALAKVDRLEDSLVAAGAERYDEEETEGDAE